MVITSNSPISSTKNFLSLPSFAIEFQMNAKVFNQEGNIKYEYNAFRNLRLATGELTDFRTKALNFDLNNPVDITVQPSYDGSVNLILNDDKNSPKLINSRFTVVEDKRYKIEDRKGNNDTNIYDLESLQQNTRLFKTSENIPYVEFTGLSDGGSNRCGNYVFYFKYSDADGNESDIIAESGIVSTHIGKINDPFSIRGGILNENSNKTIKLKLNNLDTSYDYLKIYFTRSTGDINKIEDTHAYLLSNKKIISDSKMDLIITGLEGETEIAIEELNIQYNIVDRVKTQVQIQNMLFFGNVDKPTIPYKELTDLSLRVYPSVSNDVNIGYLDQDYKPVDIDDAIRKSEYYDMGNVYNFTGFWNKEMYRLGIVYILKDDTVSPVFDIRGRDGINRLNDGVFKTEIQRDFTYYPIYGPDGKRVYVEAGEDGFLSGSSNLENTKGVVRILHTDSMINKDDKAGVYPLSINFNIEGETLGELKKYVKGFFFVRQKRIPTILAQGISLGVDAISNVPALFAKAVDSKGVTREGFLTEAFIDKNNQLVHDFTTRTLFSDNGNVTTNGLLCPEAQLRPELFNQLFTGTLYNLSEAPINVVEDSLSHNRGFSQGKENKRHFYINKYEGGLSEYLYKDVKLTLIEHDKPVKFSGTKRFSSRAGIAEEAWRFSTFTTDDKSANATNLLRGAYTGFVGMENFNNSTTIVDIHVPGYDTANMKEYFTVRANSFHYYYSMSQRYDLGILIDSFNSNTNGKLPPYTKVVKTDPILRFTEYGGDCFINNFTTRMVRNFQDPETPINDTILSALSWKNSYKGYSSNGSIEQKDLDNLNRGDVNAVRIGHWATFKVCSNINLALRATDNAQTTETELTGKARDFFPHSPMSITAESKIPESTLFNVGNASTTSDKVYNLLPDVPYIKNVFDNRIMFSDIHVNDAFRNGYRVFQGLDYKDVTRQYGAIVKMFDVKSNLLVIFENGIALFQINERSPMTEGSSIYIKGIGTLPETPFVISDMYGSSWKDSIIRSEEWIYGVDTIAKKIWRTNGQQIEIISDFKIQKFLNDNITLSEEDKKPIIGIRNVKTHYNAFKKDVMFTFYDSSNDYKEVSWNLCFNELTNKWITRYSWTPLMSENINNVFFSFDRTSGKAIAQMGYTRKDNVASFGIVLDTNEIRSNQANEAIGVLSLKGYDYYKKYDQTFVLENDAGYPSNNKFTIAGTILRSTVGGGTDPYEAIRVRCDLKLKGTNTVVESFYDVLVIKRTVNVPNDKKLHYDFWKHGQAGIFDITGEILPTKWYDKQEVFEFEFIVAEGPGTQKIYDNLYIISNNIKPHSFEFEVVGDSYEIENRNTASTGEPGDPEAEEWTIVTPKTIKTFQLGKDLKQVGRLRGNMQYIEDSWNVEIKPHYIKLVDEVGDEKEVQTRIRDKYCKIRVRYDGTGDTPALITALQTLYRISYA
jgi:hypothetical protein